MKRQEIKQILQSEATGSTVKVSGWVRTKRESKNVNFINLNDGTVLSNLQIVADVNQFEDLLKRINTGAALTVTGELVESNGQQKVELIASEIEVVGEADPDKYPLQPKRHSLEFLRDIAHLRYRTNTFSAIARVRHSMIFAVHKFFTERGFFNIHTPIITASDAEGAGEMFQVSTLDMEHPPRDEDGNIDYSEDFFGKKTNLTVSGQLEGELAALALSKIYTFGPTFRAENSNTSRHLAEFWMIEPEMAFYDLNDNMDLAEEFLKYLIRYALDNCMEDLQFLSQRQQQEEKNKPQDQRSMELIEKLKFVAENDFVRLTYTEAINILENSKPAKKGQFQYPLKGFGTDLQSEHERFLVEKHFKKPVILIDYPANIKAFYMKVNEDGKTVAAMDVLFPQIGEIIGGSQREERFDVLVEKMKAMDIPLAEMDWYLDTRRYGSVPHSGFGLGFERLITFVTGMSNIRDVIPFPRTPKNCEF
ncbi:asparagine--tRNA ligase [Roseimarinus sediminis]|uniref:asparagine--tRNA ligase n=1 Tax=Roseimarinus sediminis TaxID=1610899 RepID=UPI003D19BF97